MEVAQQSTQRQGHVNKRGVKSLYQEVHVGELGDLPVFHAESLRWIPLGRLGQLPRAILER